MVIAAESKCQAERVMHSLQRVRGHRMFWHEGICQLLTKVYFLQIRIQLTALIVKYVNLLQKEAAKV